MKKHNPKNERIKRKYLAWLGDAKRQSVASVDAAAAALAGFEAYTRFKDFKAFHHEQASAFKRHLAMQNSQTTGSKLSKATQHATLSHLKRFFQWLSGQPGYKSHVQYSDAEYFNISEKDSRIATARRVRPAPTLEQIRHVISLMPSTTDVEKRDRALITLTFLTGARDSAIASLKLKHVDLTADCLYQDARDVNTKFSKTFATYFFPVGEDIRRILAEWIEFLRIERLWGNDEPLFPKTKVAVGPNGGFEAAGLDREHWSTTTPIREVFKRAFVAAGLPYFNPHSFRHTLVALGAKLCQTPEAFKAWSQNLGHEGVLTTLYSYGQVPVTRQSEIIRSLGTPSAMPDHVAQMLLRTMQDPAILQALQAAARSGNP